jgi:hypothetical protein
MIEKISRELPMPGTFVVERSAIVRITDVDPNSARRLAPAAILDALRGARS